MPGSEPGGQSRYIFAPGKSIAAIIIDQALRGRPQSRKLAGVYSRNAGHHIANRGQCGLCNDSYLSRGSLNIIRARQLRGYSVFVFFFEIFQSLIIIRRVSLFVG
jgi:hypothetical protein